MLKSISSLLLGSDERVIKKLASTIKAINSKEHTYSALSDSALKTQTEKFKHQLEHGETLEDIKVEAFAAVREATKRSLGQRHYDVQLIGGLVLHQGKIAEMKTGEGKTLVATLPSYLNSLTGGGVHVVTVNDYLARRDAQWMGAIYHTLGISVGVLQHDAAFMFDPFTDSNGKGWDNLRSVQRREAYAADITYGTNNEFGFDYLRDNMVVDLSERVQRHLSYAIVDEVDNILIDEARTPLIISGPAAQSPSEYQKFAQIVPNLKDEEDFIVDEKHKSVALTTSGIGKLERLLKVNNLYDTENFRLVHFVENAVKAQVIFQKDREYVVHKGQVVIVDEFTGRLMEGRRYSDGLHQALEAKERVKIERESITYATVTLQNYFRLYGKLAGMTGTAATEAEEFWKIYKLDVVSIPTNAPMIRSDSNDLIYRDREAKYLAIVNDIEQRVSDGQPVLVGTTDIDKSELLSSMLIRKGIKHEVLNAKQHEREAVIIAQAGVAGAVTVATNMAGRGTDIVLGGNPDAIDITKDKWVKDHNAIVGKGGLHIIGTERHEARRIDNQLRGRSGRQGDPGSTNFYVALDDELMRRFGGDRIRSIMDWAGLEDSSPIQNKMITRSIENAQVKVESHHFDMRKHLVDYDDVVNTHRDVVYHQRNLILHGNDLRTQIQEMVEREIIAIISDHTEGRMPDTWDVGAMLAEIFTVAPIEIDSSQAEALRKLPGDTLAEQILHQVVEVYDKIEAGLGTENMRVVERQIMLRTIDMNWVQHLTAMENLRQGIGLHAYGQRDPLVMYRKEAHDMFQALQDRIENDIVRTIFHFGISPTQNSTHSRRHTRSVSSQTPPRFNSSGASGVAQRAPQIAQKIGRNQTCPCGSTKKYKKCCGTEAP